MRIEPALIFGQTQMAELFQAVRFPFTLAMGFILIVILPPWAITACAVLLLRTAAIPLALVKFAFQGEEAKFQAFVRETFSGEFYFGAYPKCWADLAKWQETGR